MRLRSLLIFTVVVLIAVPMFAGHGWSTYHWGRSCSTCEASIEVRKSLTNTAYANWNDHLQKSVFGDPANPNTANRRGWNDSEVLALNVTVGASDASYRQSCPSISNAVRVCNYPYGSTGWAGLAQINLNSSGHIAWGTAKMNDTYFGAGSTATWARHVMCQEVGHDFGLGHTSENGSSQNTCMDYYRNTSNSDWTSTGPNQHDFDQLRAQHHYGASLTPSVQSRATIGLADGVSFNEPWEWGTPIEWDSEGRAVVYKFEYGDGQAVITHVYWAHPDMIERAQRNIERK